MTTKQLTAVNTDNQIKQLYQTAFPEEEQIPWDDLLRLIGEMELDFTAYYEGEDFIGFTIVYPRPEYLKSPTSRRYSPRTVHRWFQRLRRVRLLE